ncbi:hypothetical protein [uncultured Williamsia sp.]|uniref:hypothetical protein n=1 Tax=uncultured Williamsia sp. TaxID=259311 RepID=UPI00261DD474|nr:hypothetical protein [uncultured Williamsia sp.]
MGKYVGRHSSIDEAEQSPSPKRRSFLRSKWTWVVTTLIAVASLTATVTFGSLNFSKDPPQAGNVFNAPVTFFNGPQAPITKTTTEPNQPVSGSLYQNGPCPDNPRKAGWGPARDILPRDKFSPLPSFNSDNFPEVIGDERGFFGIRDVTYGEQSEPWRYSMGMEPGHTYRLRIFIHNSGDQDTVAKGTRLIVGLPTCTGRRIATSAIISASNANPREVWGGVNLFSDRVFNIAYLNGSALYCNNYFKCSDGGEGGVRLSEDFLTSRGALLGYDALNGEFRGNYDFSAFFSFRIKPQFAPER